MVWSQRSNTFKRKINILSSLPGNTTGRSVRQFRRRKLPTICGGYTERSTSTTTARKELKIVQTFIIFLFPGNKGRREGGGNIRHLYTSNIDATLQGTKSKRLCGVDVDKAAPLPRPGGGTGCSEYRPRPGGRRRGGGGGRRPTYTFKGLEPDKSMDAHPLQSELLPTLLPAPSSQLPPTGRPLPLHQHFFKICFNIQNKNKLLQ